MISRITKISDDDGVMAKYYKMIWEGRENVKHPDTITIKIKEPKESLRRLASIDDPYLEGE